MPQVCSAYFDETLLTGFLDGVITARERQIVRAHLMTCADCRSLLSDLGDIRRACLTTRFRAGRFAIAGDCPAGGAVRPIRRRR